MLEPEASIDPDAFYPPLCLLIDGEWVEAAGRGTHSVRDPSTAHVIGRLPKATPADVQRALEAARAAFLKWRSTPAAARAAVLVRAAGLMRERAEAIARTITLELGKPLAESMVEVDRLAGVFEWHAAEAQRIYGRLVPGIEGTNNIVEREPVGVVAAFTPWNGPAASPGRKITAALAAGCMVVIRPAEETPGSAIWIARCLMHAGLPPGR